MGSEWTTIGAVAEVFDGPHATPKKIDSGPYFLSISSLEAGKLDLMKSARLSEKDFVRWTRRVTPIEGDVLFSYETRLGEAALMPANVRACLGRRMGLLRPKRSKVIPEYLLYSYLSPQFQGEIRTRTVPGCTVDRIPLKDLSGFPIRIPSMKEQHEVVRILSAIDRKIELNRQTNQTLESMAQALFKSWFVDFDPVIDNALAAGNEIPEPLAAKAAVRRALREQGADKVHQPHTLPDHIRQLFPSRFQFTEELGWIPEGWLETQVKDLASIIKGKSYKSSELQDSKTALVTLKSFNRGGGYRLDGLKEYTGKYKPEQEVYAGDLIVAYTDVTQAADVIGKPAMVVSDNRYEHLVISLDVGVVRPNQENYRYFLYGTAQTDRFQDHTRSFTTGTTVLHLAKDAVPGYTLADPGEVLVDRFAQVVQPLYKAIDKNVANGRVLQSLRDNLLPKLLSGELRIPEAEKALDEALA